MLDKKYEHKNTEANKYQIWKEKGYFKADNTSDKTPFCIVIPPPNVTGKLHIGHAYDTSLQDVIVRYKRMQGFDTLWLPGMDHAAIATEAKVVKKLKDQGIDKYEYGREKFLEACWDWTREYGGSIRDQWAGLGLSVDYTRERFTLDDDLNRAVRKVFVDYYNQGIIYRGERIINWDPEAQTALSNEEVIYKDVEGAFYHLKYKVAGSEEFLDVATTRPETLFGDTAVAVNPEDERYKHLIGKKVVLPVLNKEIPIVADEHADPEFGTGCVKITPAHDPNDFEVGNRHNLERVVVMNSDATMNENAGKYCGMTREKCREELLKDLEADGLLLSIEKMTHSVGHSERTGVMVEPYLSKQWFVKMGPLAEKVLKFQKDKDKKVNFVPKRFEKILNHWMEISYDWCISRQLWWGHRIPAWYKDEELYVGMEAPEGEGWKQDEDVLDTWFSSALWPFSTLGWPDKTVDLERYFPTDCLVTGYDIIFFWVARMTFQSEFLNDVRPFKDCVIHGLIRDKEGRKMSKSLGNGVDPFDMVDKYGADSLRYYLSTDGSMGMDLRFDEVKLTSTWNYINKIWNASRFTLMNIEDLTKVEFKNLKLEDKWILTKYNKVLKSVTKHMDKYEFNLAGAEIYDFVWTDFCSSYIELSKYNLESNTTKSVLYTVLMGILKMLHPFMPFVTEEIYGMLPMKDAESIMISEYPKYNKKHVFEEEMLLVDEILKDIVEIRNIKANNNIKKDAKVLITSNNEEALSIYKAQLKITDEYEITSPATDLASKTFKSNYVEITYYYEEEKVDTALLEEEIKKLEASIARRKNLLSNENYVNKAPANIVEQDRKKLEEEEQKLANLKQQI